MRPTNPPDEPLYPRVDGQYFLAYDHEDTAFGNLPNPPDEPLYPIVDGQDVQIDEPEKTAIRDLPNPPDEPRYPNVTGEYFLEEDRSYHQVRYFEAIQTEVPRVLTALFTRVFPHYEEFRARAAAALARANNGRVPEGSRAALKYHWPRFEVSFFPARLWDELVHWGEDHRLLCPTVGQPARVNRNDFNWMEIRLHNTRVYDRMTLRQLLLGWCDGDIQCQAWHWAEGDEFWKCSDKAFGVMWALRTAFYTMRAWHDDRPSGGLKWSYPPTPPAHPGRKQDELLKALEFDAEYRLDAIPNRPWNIFAESEKASEQRQIREATAVIRKNIARRKEYAQKLGLRPATRKFEENHYTWLALFQTDGKSPHELAETEFPVRPKRSSLDGTAPRQTRKAKFNRGQIEKAIKRTAHLVAGDDWVDWIRKLKSGPAGNGANSST